MAFQELKDRQAFVWGNAPFETVADSLADVHEAIIAAVGPAEGKRWLEVACGTGELADRAARAGAGMPLAWGTPDRVRELLGDAFELQFEERCSTWGAPSAEEYWQRFSPGFGPVKTLLENSDDAKRAEIHDAFVDYLEQNFAA